jgi:hypothetical protein
VLVLV